MRMTVALRCVGLPDIDRRILNRVPFGVIDGTINLDDLALCNAFATNDFRQVEVLVLLRDSWIEWTFGL